RAAQKKRELTIGDGLLGKVVIHAKRMSARIAEVLSGGHAGVRSDELKRRGFAGTGDDDGCVLHRAELLQFGDDAGDGRLLLTDGDVEAVNALPLLVDDGVDGDGGLAGLAVADDELALSASDRHHAVDGLDAGLERLFDRLASQDARRLHLDASSMRRLDRAL